MRAQFKKVTKTAVLVCFGANPSFGIENNSIAIAAHPEGWCMRTPIRAVGNNFEFEQFEMSENNYSGLLEFE